MKLILSLIVLLLCYSRISAQEKVGFDGPDGLHITADLYLKDYRYPFILLFHQAESSRGEYREIAKKLLNLDYNCLAVDLRSGDTMNFVKNETALDAQRKHLPDRFIDARSDVLAAINYIGSKSTKPVVLFGSSYSASLCLLAAKNNPNVKAVVAFSPGEYFRPEITMKDKLKGFDKPVFVAASRLENEYVVKMMEQVPDNLKTVYTPPKSKGTHGAKALWNSSKDSEAYWLELLLFFKKIK